jgi:hypothetical protein
MTRTLQLLGTTENFHYWLEPEREIVVTSISPNPADPTHGAHMPPNKWHEVTLRDFILQNQRGHHGSWRSTKCYDRLRDAFLALIADCDAIRAVGEQP